MGGDTEPYKPVHETAAIAELARNRPGVALYWFSHVIDQEWMREAYRLTRKSSAPGIDGVVAAEYESNLEANLQSLLDRIRSGSYKAPPVRRAYIPRRTVRKGRSASRPSKIRWRNVRSAWYWKRSTSRTSTLARMASDPADRRIKRFKHCARAL